MPNLTLSHDAWLVLSRSLITVTSVTLPPGQLPRPLYVEIDKALRNAGGKWDRGNRSHVFTTDPREILLDTLGDKKSVDQKQKFQSFFTPNDLAARLAELADVNGKLCLEPSAGMGALAWACRNHGAVRVDCFEIKPDFAKKLDADGFSCGVTDFLSVNPSSNFQYDRVVMNPPFTKGQGVRHIKHALKFLKLDGLLVSIISNGPREQATLKPSAREWISLESGAFKESGTSIQTAIVIIDSAGLGSGVTK